MHAVSKKRRQRPHPQSPCNPWFNEKCTIARKKAAEYAKIHDITTPYHKSAYNGLRKQYKSVTQAEKRKYKLTVGKSLDNLVSRAPNEFWKYLNSLSQKGSKASSQIPLQEFHQYFESQNTIPAQHYFDKDFMHKIEESVKNFEYKEASNSDDIIVSDVLDSPITRAEITRALKNLKNHKAPGPDGIPAEFLRQGEMEIGNTMYPSFNAILEKGEYPRKWAEGRINPTYKKGDPQDPDNYRKITILNSSSKVFESTINNRLTFKNDMMAHSDPYQAGFKKESRTNDNIFTLYSAIQIQKSIKKPLYTCFVDFTKSL